MKKPVCLPLPSVPYVSTRPSGVSTACAAINGQAKGGDHAPRTLSAKEVEHNASAHDAAAKRIRIDMMRPLNLFFSAAPAGLLVGMSLTEAFLVTSHGRNVAMPDEKWFRFAVMSPA